MRLPANVDRNPLGGMLIRSGWENNARPQWLFGTVFKATPLKAIAMPGRSGHIVLTHIAAGDLDVAIIRPGARSFRH